MGRAPSPADRAITILNDVLEHELSDDQAVEVAKAYAWAGIAQQQAGMIEVMKNLAIAATQLAGALEPILDALAAERITKQAQTLAEMAQSGVEDFTTEMPTTIEQFISPEGEQQ